MVYLLKVTLAWAIFLLLYEMLYKSNGRFLVNRVYLIAAIAAGLLLPLIPAPSPIPVAVIASQPIYPAMQQLAPIINSSPQLITASSDSAPNSLDLGFILLLLYSIVAAFLLLKALLEAGRIARLIHHHPARTIAGHQVIITGRSHTPYSYMGWIFIGSLLTYKSAELEYIVRHEAAHNRQKHWLDLLLLQIACIALWFHPLIWRYRYLLQLQHEYEADHLAARDDAYGYGHFLLQQTLLHGVPSIAHSFHFSPIKNRINMLTKRQNKRPGAWKYLLMIPALLGCTFLMAKSAITAGRVRQGNVTTYNGNTFKWRETDTLFYDRVARTLQRTSPANKQKKQIIYELNGEPVYQNEYLKTPASYGSDEMAYSDYLKKEFVTLRKNLPDSVTAVTVVNLVINKEGKVAYYDLKSIRPFNRFHQKIEWSPYGDQEPVLNRIMDQIIRNAPDWKPAMVNGKPVNSLINIGGGC